MQLRFTKMHGLGNDFVVIDAIHQPVKLSAQQIRQIADRHFGVGCDQLLLVESPQSATADFHYRIFNADGGEVEQCGNGARCFARFVRDQGLTDKDCIPVETAAGQIELRIMADGQVQVDMGQPVLEPAAIPFLGESAQPDYPLEVEGQILTIAAVSLGNPHAVLRVEDVKQAPVARLGPAIGAHPRFPQGVNVGFMQVVDRRHIRLRVYERGAGETLACGSGACAAVVAGQRLGWLDQQVRVSLTGGDLMISWPGAGEHVIMTGPATSVFEGTLLL